MSSRTDERCYFESIQYQLTLVKVAPGVASVLFCPPRIATWQRLTQQCSVPFYLRTASSSEDRLALPSLLSFSGTVSNRADRPTEIAETSRSESTFLRFASIGFGKLIMDGRCHLRLRFRLIDFEKKENLAPVLYSMPYESCVPYRVIILLPLQLTPLGRIQEVMQRTMYN